MTHLARDIMESALSVAFLSDISKWLTLNIGLYKGFWEIIQNAYTITQIVGFALMTTFFLKALLQESSKDNLTIETLGRLMIGLVLSLTVIIHIPEITNAFLMIAESISSKILGDTVSLNDYAANVAEACATWKENTPNPIAFIQALAFFLVHQICVIAFDFAVISRAFDIGWRVAIAPISCADMFNGENSSGVRHLKSIFGSALVAVVIAIIAKAGAVLVSGFISSGMEGSMWMGIACQAAMAGVAIGANQKAKEIL